MLPKSIPKIKIVLSIADQEKHIKIWKSLEKVILKNVKERKRTNLYT